MEFRTEQHAGATYLVYEIKQGDKIDKLSMGMLVNNNIPGVLQTSTFTEDSRKTIKYNISSKITLEKFMAGILDKSQTLGIFSSICATILSTEEYMLEISQLILEPNNIYINVSTLEISMAVLPLEDLREETDFKKFFKEILFCIKFNVKEDSAYIAQLSNYLNFIENFSIKDFRKFVNKLIDEKDAPVSGGQERRPQIPSLNSNFGTSFGSDSGPQSLSEFNPVFSYPVSKIKPEAPQPPKEKKRFFAKKEKKVPVDKKEKAALPAKGFLIPGMEKPITLTTMGTKAGSESRGESTEKKKEKKSWFSFGKKNKQEDYAPAQSASDHNAATIITPVIMSGIPQNTGETTVLKAMPQGMGETTVLGATSAEYQAYLIRKKGNLRINISNQVFRMGKERNYVDYCIEDNSAVSRSHADIISENNGFYIIDNNSLNHTFIDGVQVPPGNKKRLQDGSKILLADEEFMFYIRK